MRAVFDSRISCCKNEFRNNYSKSSKKYSSYYRHTCCTVNIVNSLGLVTVLFERSVHFIGISLVLEPVDEGGSSSLNPVTCYSNVMNEQVRQRDIHLLIIVHWQGVELQRSHASKRTAWPNKGSRTGWNFSGLAVSPVATSTFRAPWFQITIYFSVVRGGITDVRRQRHYIRKKNIFTSALASAFSDVRFVVCIFARRCVQLINGQSYGRHQWTMSPV